MKVYLVRRRYFTSGFFAEAGMAGIGATLDDAKALAADQVLKWYGVADPLEWEARRVFGGVTEWYSFWRKSVGGPPVSYVITEEPVHEAAQ